MRPVSTIDIVPTVLELLGLSAAEDLDGEPLLRTRTTPVISQAPDATMVRDGPLKLVLGQGRAPTIFDLGRDPREAQDIAQEQPLQVDELQQKLRAASRPPRARPVARRALEPEELEALRVLGYVE